jgi:hypothetical protein
MLKLILFYIWPCLALAGAQMELGVTYGFSGGRLGDHLISYLHAKWVACELGLPLLYKPFPYSSFLMIDEKEAHFETAGSHLQIQWPAARPPATDERIVYHCPYFPEDAWERAQYPIQIWKVNWKDPIFRKEALSMIAPKKTLPLVHPPENCISIALHYRDGGGFDHTIRAWPLKFPRLDFYLDALQKVVELTRGRSLYCFVFTDARHPLSVVKELKSAFPQIQFEARRQKNRYYLNVLEDFFSFFQFDILIRPQSNFSMVPSLLHDFAICHFPVHAEPFQDSFIITQTCTQIEETLLEKILFQYDL